MKEGFSRRDFIKLTGLISGALAIPDGMFQYLNQQSILPEQSSILSEQDFKATHEVFYGDKDRKVILMTYDDFNSPKNIEVILDAYKTFNAKATFFFPGGYSRENITITNYGNQIERIVDEGHVLGCHGLIHDPLTTYDDNKLRNDLELWLKILENIIPGYKVEWIRFPFGDRNSRVKDVATEFGMQSVMWSLESGGTDEKTFERVTNKVVQGDIVLSHTSRYYDAQQAHKIVENIISRGYDLESVETGLKSEFYYPNYLTSLNKSKAQNDFSPRNKDPWQVKNLE